MRTPSRLITILAAVAALLGAPSSVSGAVNDLTACTVSPAAGTDATTFSFAARYAGRFAATSVTATVANRAIPMSLVSGTPESGTWTASAQLPPGTWPLLCAAQTAKGPSAALAGPTVSVAGIVTAPPTSAPASLGPRPIASDTAAGADGGAAGEGATPPPPAAPASASPPHQPSPIARPGQGETGQPSPEAAGGAAHGGSASPATDGGAPAPGGEPVTGASVGPRPHDSPASETHGATVHESPADRIAATEGFLVIGAVGMATLALFGVLLLILPGRRRNQESPAAPASGSDDEDRAPADVLERRALRRARIRLGDDPIVAAMGVDRQMSKRRAARGAGQASEGPGERPVRRG